MTPDRLAEIRARCDARPRAVWCAPDSDVDKLFWLAQEVPALLADRDALQAERDRLVKENAVLTHKVITCGVAAHHSNPDLTRTGAYANEWNSPQAEDVRKLRAERDAAAKVVEAARLAELSMDTICLRDAHGVLAILGGEESQYAQDWANRHANLVAVLKDYDTALGGARGEG